MKFLLVQDDFAVSRVLKSSLAMIDVFGLLRRDSYLNKVYNKLASSTQYSQYCCISDVVV